MDNRTSLNFDKLNIAIVTSIVYKEIEMYDLVNGIKKRQNRHNETEN